MPGLTFGVIKEQHPSHMVLSDNTRIALVDGLILERFDAGPRVAIAFERDEVGAVVAQRRGIPGERIEAIGSGPSSESGRESTSVGGSGRRDVCLLTWQRVWLVWGNRGTQRARLAAFAPVGPPARGVSSRWVCRGTA